MRKLDGFTQWVDEARSFFAELDADNTREWFQPRKEHYATAIRQPAELLAELVGEEITRLTSKSHAAKVYRIHRDVRFSKDKRPYNAHVHVLWSQGGVKAEADPSPAWFFACSPTILTINMGVATFKGEALTAYRKMIDEDGDALVEAITSTGFRLSDWGEAALKKVPVPYDAAHPHAAWLKRRSLILDAPLGESWRAEGTGLLSAITAQCLTMLPVWRLLDAHSHR